MNFKDRSRVFRIGFVGGAPHSAVGYAHYSALKMDGLWSLEAGAFSRSGEKNQSAAEIYGVDKEKAFGNFEALLEYLRNERMAIAVLTPTPLHYEMVVACLAAGVPVICEKSLATSSDEARKIHQLVQEKKGFLAVVYNYSGYPMVRELRNMIREGVLGDILHFQAEMPQEGFLRTDQEGNKLVPQDWRQRDGFVPTIHLDLAVHLHELIHYLTGAKPTEVVAQQSSRGWFPVVDNVQCLARYSGAIEGQFWFSKCALGDRNGLRIRIFGSKGSAEWYQMQPEEVQLAMRDGQKKIVDRASNPKIAGQPRYTRFKAGHPAGFIEALANLYYDFHAALSEYYLTGVQRSDEVFGAELAVEGLEFLEAMARSVVSKKWETC